MSYQPPPSTARGIVFHQAYPWLFSEPEVLPASAGILGSQAGVYAILTDGIRIGPRPFRVLYFGEADNVRARATTTHETCAAWRREPGYGTLYRAIHWMPESSREAVRGKRADFGLHPVLQSAPQFRLFKALRREVTANATWLNSRFGWSFTARGRGLRETAGDDRAHEISPGLIRPVLRIDYFSRRRALLSLSLRFS